MWQIPYRPWVSEAFVHIGEAIRQWRENGDKPLTREELAEKIGRCISTVRNWERGTEPRFTDIKLMESAKPGLVKLLFLSGVRFETAPPWRPSKARRKRGKHQPVRRAVRVAKTKARVRGAGKRPNRR